jgi:nucleotidyltransferase substrate binding protein (TIGR01987 family)
LSDTETEDRVIAFVAGAAKAKLGATRVVPFGSRAKRTHSERSDELAWTTLKTQLKEQGIESQEPRDVFKAAWKIGILSVGEESAWVKMIEDRNLTAHAYDEAFARAMVERIRKTHEPALQALRRLWKVD